MTAVTPDGNDSERWIVDLATDYFSGNDLAFAQRVWTTPRVAYSQRLDGLGFRDLDCVVDAGCGMGQWAICLAKRNSHVVASDVSPQRLAFVKAIATRLGLHNIDYVHSDLESMTLSRSCQGIFCYGVLMLTDYLKVLERFSQMLESRGKLYLSTASLGWYLENLIHPRNPASDFDPQKMAIAAFRNTLHFLSGGAREVGSQLIVPSRTMCSVLNRFGFIDIKVGADGQLSNLETGSYRQFFQAEYFGEEGVYEIVATAR